MQDHLPSDDEICALYKQGLPMAEVGVRLNVGKAYVRKVLQRCGVEARTSKQRSPAKQLATELQYARAAAVYMSGSSYRDIEQRLRVSKERVRAAVIRFGGAIRVQRKLTDEEKAERARVSAERTARRIARQVERGSTVGLPRKRVSTAQIKHLYTEDRLPTQRIADMLGIDKNTVLARLERAGVARRTRREVWDLRHVINQTVVTEAELRQLYEVEQLSIKATAARLGISHGRADGLLRRYNIVRRSASFRTGCSKAA